MYIHVCLGYLTISGRRLQWLQRGKAEGSEDFHYLVFVKFSTISTFHPYPIHVSMCSLKHKSNEQTQRHRCSTWYSRR
jgi:hypothetical protein